MSAVRTWRLIGGSKPKEMMHTGPVLKPMEIAEVVELGPVLDLLELTVQEADDSHEAAKAFLRSHGRPEAAA